MSKVPRSTPSLRQSAPLDWELLVLFVTCNLLYPLWFLPDAGFFTRIGTFHGLWGLFLLGWFVLHLLPLDPETTILSLPDSWNWDGRRTWVLLLFGVGALLFHLYQQLRWHPPTPSKADFHQYLAESGGVAYFLRSNLTAPLVSLLTVGGLVLVAWGLHRWRRRGTHWVRSYSTPLFLALAYGLSLCAAILLASSGIIEQLGGEYFVFRLPPLGKFLHLAYFLVVGLHEVPIRILQVFFLIGAVAVWLAGSNDSLHWPRAAVGLGFLPFHVNGFFLDNTLVNLMFYFLILFAYREYLHHRSSSRLAVLYSWIGIGMMIRREVVFVGLVVTIHLLSTLLRQWDFNLRTWIPLGWGVATALLSGPFLFIGMILKVRPASFQPLELLQGEKWIHLLRTFNRGAGLPVLILFGFCFLRYQFRKRNTLTRILAVYFAIVLVILVSRPPMYSLRHNLILFVPFVIGTGEVFSDLLATYRGIPAKVVPAMLLGSCLLVPYLTSNQPLILKEWNYYHPKDPFNHNRETRELLPYPQLMEYLRASGLSNTGIFAPMRTEPSHFYLFKYQLVDRLRWVRKPYFTDFDRVEELLTFCRERNLTHVVSPTGDYALSRLRHTPVLDDKHLKWFRQSDRFRTVKRFRYRGYELTLHRIRKEASSP